MEYCKGIQKIEVFENDFVIKSSADGITNVEEIAWLKDKLVEISKNWEGKKWAYIADISKLQIVPTEVSSELIQLHVEIYNNGCVCVGFFFGFCFSAVTIKLAALTFFGSAIFTRCMFCHDDMASF